jgi:hypothetical protein
MHRPMKRLATLLLLAIFLSSQAGGQPWHVVGLPSAPGTAELVAAPAEAASEAILSAQTGTSSLLPGLQRPPGTGPASEGPLFPSFLAERPAVLPAPSGLAGRAPTSTARARRQAASWRHRSRAPPVA